MLHEGRVEIKKEMTRGSRWEKSFGIISSGVVPLGSRFTSDNLTVEELVKGVISSPGGK